MPRNPIQFQSGLSLPEFLERYGDEQQCRDALFQIRWPAGFVCPECGNDTYCVISQSKRFQCNRCHHQTSLTREPISTAAEGLDALADEAYTLI